MAKQQDAFSRLINALKVLPNVGPKSVQRIAYHLLQHDRKGAAELARTLDNALLQVRHCARCNTFCEGETCDICADPARDGRRLMIVHMPADVAGMEAARCHDGLYFVLMGQISPAQGMDLLWRNLIWAICITTEQAWRRIINKPLLGFKKQPIRAMLTRNTIWV